MLPRDLDEHLYSILLRPCFVLTLCMLANYDVFGRVYRSRWNTILINLDEDTFIQFLSSTLGQKFWSVSKTKLLSKFIIVFVYEV